MPVNVLFSARQELWPAYETALQAAFADHGVQAHLRTDIPAADVDYIIYAPNSGLSDFTPYSRAKAVLSLWAGVEQIVGNATLRIPLARMVNPGLTQGMIEWVTAHVLRHHLGIDQDILNDTAQWSPRTPHLASERTVAILGLGALGQAVARTLFMLGFRVTGWSRGPKKVEGVRCFHGPDGLTESLSHAEIIVTLLPDTPETENILNERTLKFPPPGAFIINPGRGSLIDDDALLAALDRGQIAHATLDVFRTEPLPREARYWSHPCVTVTPHIAAETRPATAAQVIAENIRRGETGQDFLHLVDRSLGY